MTLRIEELESRLELTGLKPQVKQLVEILVAAVNDWPTPVTTMEEYEVEVRLFLGNAVVRKNIEISRGQINFGNNAWEAESLAQLVDAFQFYPEGTTLPEIIDHVKTEWGQACDIRDSHQ